MSGDEIWVAQGTHTPGTQRTATFQLKSGVGVYGGFAGTETTRSQRDWVAHPTVLSGDIGTLGDNDDNAYHVVTGSGTDATAVLDGFTVSGGNANGSGADRRGGGMYNSNSSPTLTDVTFSGNSTSDGGGGVYNEHSSHPTLTNCILWGNAAPQISNWSSSSSATVTYSDVQGGHAGTGNIDADPLFVDADGPDDVAGTLDDNLRLRVGSPAIDVGDNNAVPAGVTTDLDGNPRTIGDAVDMGAYEGGHLYHVCLPLVVS